MSRLIVEIEAPDLDRSSGRADQFGRNKFAAALRLIADSVQTGRLEGEITAGELQGRYCLEATDEAADAAA
jgi:hypothetical protein